MLEKSNSLLVNEGTTNVIQGSNTELSPQDMVTEISTVSVKPGMEQAYRDLVERTRQVEARFPGYQGLQLQPPILGLQDDWVSLLRFDTAEHLNAWLESDTRRAALQEVDPLTQPLGMAESTFIGNALNVAATGFLLIPLALRAFEWWLLPGPSVSARVEAAGIALVVGGYLLSIAVFALLT